MSAALDAEKRSRSDEPACFVPVDAYVQRWSVSPDEDVLLDNASARRLPPRFHFLMSRTGGSVVEPVLSFLADKYTIRLRGVELKRKRSFPSLVASAYDLKDLTDFLDAQKCTFADLSEELLNTYVASMTEVKSPVTNKPYADLTIIRRVSSAKQFCSWAQEKGRLKHRFESERVAVVLDRDTNDHKIVTKFAPDVEAPGPPDRTLHVNVLHPTDAPVLLNTLGPLPPLSGVKQSRKNAADRRPFRNRLMAECALQTGLRRAGVVGLTLASIRSCRTTHASSPTHMCVVRVTSKYGKEQPVNFPFWLVEALRHYIATERAEAVEAGRRRHPSYEEPPTVFLNHAHSIKAPGNPVAAETFNEFFHQAQIDTGLATVETVVDKDTNVRRNVTTVPYVVHDLRHTYAVWTYWRRKRAGDHEPWKYIQAQLGHRHLSTTTDIYLRAAVLFEAQFSDAYMDALKEQIYA